jgi:hypothetical protein
MKLKLSYFLMLISTAIIVFSCQKDNRNPETERAKPREIKPVFVKDTGVYIPIESTDSVRFNPSDYFIPTKDSLARQIENDQSKLTDISCCVNLSLIDKNGSTYTLIAYFEAGADPTTNYYLRKGNTRVAYLGSKSQLGSQSLAFTANLDCGAYYYVEVEHYHRNYPSTIYQWDTYSSVSQKEQIFGYNDISVAGAGNEGQGADVVLYDINGNGILDMFVMANDNPAGPNFYKYKVLYDLNSTGVASSSSVIKSIPTGLNEVAGSGMAIADIDRNGIPDLVLMSYDDPSGPNSFVYKIGWNLNSNGDPTSWSSNIVVSGVSDLAQGAGLAIADIDNNGILDIVLMALNPPGAGLLLQPRYKVGFNLSTSGIASSWSPGAYLQADIFGGTAAQGFGLKIVDLLNDGKKWFFMTQNDHGTTKNTFQVFAYPITTAGVKDGSISYSCNSFGIGQQSQGAGVAIGDIDRDGVKDIILMTYDNPAGANYFKYNALFGMLTDYNRLIFTRGYCY